MTARHDERPDDDTPGAVDEGQDDELEASDEASDEEHDPDDVPEVNAWLTIVMFALFVVTTVGCYLWLDGWH